MKDKTVMKNPSSIQGHFHDSPNIVRFVKRLRSRQRRIADKLFTKEQSN